MQKTLFDYLETQQNQVITLQKDLVAMQAVGPENNGPGEGQKADYLQQYLQHLGLEKIIQMPASDPRVQGGQRPNLAAILPGKDSSRTYWIVAHLDVVPAGDPKLWNTEPFKLQQDGDLIFGRGVEDNQHGLLSGLLCLQGFILNALQPARNLGLLLVSDEETGNKYGLDHVLRHHGQLFSNADEFLVPDFGTADSGMLEVAEKGMLWVKFSIQGKQCHASTPEKGNNSLRAAARLILELETLQKKFNLLDQMFSPVCSTFEPTKIEANVPNINTIPGSDVFYLDCRVLPDYKLTDVLNACREMAEELATRTNTMISVETVHQEDPVPRTDPDHPMVRSLQESIAQVYGCQPRAQGIGGGTVAAYLRRMGFPAVVWATLLGTAHQPNEHTSVTNIINDAKVMALQLL